MLQWVVDKEGMNWDLLLPYLLFTICETSQVSKTLQDGIIEESANPRSSPILVVLKPDGVSGCVMTSRS